VTRRWINLFGREIIFETVEFAFSPRRREGNVTLGNRSAPRTWYLIFYPVFSYSFFDPNSPRIEWFLSKSLRFEYPIYVHDNLLKTTLKSPIFISRIHQNLKNQDYEWNSKKTHQELINNSNLSMFMDGFEYVNHDWSVGERTQHYENIHTSIWRNKSSIRKRSWCSFFFSSFSLL